MPTPPLRSRARQDDEAIKVVEFGRRFCRIVRRGCSGAQAEPGIIATFDAWLADAQACGVGMVESFAVSLDQDGAAVRAGLCLPWISGQDEGQVNRLKPPKRAMYGRAKLDLLRRRFLLDDVTGAPNTGPFEVGWSSLRMMVSEVNGVRFGPAPSIIEGRP